MIKKSPPSGIDSVDPPLPGSTPRQAVEHYLSGYEAEFKKARRTVKARASRVTVLIAVLTGILAILGSVGALLAGDWFSAAIAVATTTVSASIAVLLAWNDHFHHKELWIQRSTVLARINDVRRLHTLRSGLPWYMRRSQNLEAARTLEQLNVILEDDLEEWTRIQGGQVAPRVALR